MGEDVFWDVDLEETPLEDDLALMDEEGLADQDGEGDAHRRNANAMDFIGDSDVEEDDDDEVRSIPSPSTTIQLNAFYLQVESNSATERSPVDLVHALGVFVHSSPQRMEEVERVRAIKNPETSKSLLPLKDVVTRWNSKEAAIERVL